MSCGHFSLYTISSKGGDICIYKSISERKRSINTPKDDIPANIILSFRGDISNDEFIPTEKVSALLLLSSKKRYLSC